MDKSPMELYLQTHDDDGDEVGEITFCYDNIYRCDTRYVRADIADDLLAALKVVRPQCDVCDRPAFWEYRDEDGRDFLCDEHVKSSLYKHKIDEIPGARAAEAAVTKAEGKE